MARKPHKGWRGPEYPGEFPTLGYQVAQHIEAKCAIPDGDHGGEPYLLTDEMIRFLLWFYRIDPATGKFVFYRGSQLVRPQKWGKGPLSSAVICTEASPEGPVIFDGWDANGEPVGRPWATPWIQVTAYSEDQTDNVWDALVPMIEMGALAADIPDTGKTRINLPNGGKIEPVTSSAQSRLGQRITFAVQDETHSWLEAAGMRKVADNQRRNVAGMKGRWMETSNAWDPTEESVAQQTSEAKEPGVFFDDVEPGAGSIRNKRDRRRMLKKVYGDSWWVDLDRIEGEIEALLGRDPGQAERYYLNRKYATESAAFDRHRWDQLENHIEIPKDEMIVIGVDGARFVDAVAVVATDIKSGHQWPIKIIERPAKAPDDYEHPFDEVDGALTEAFETWDVWRMYVDPQWIEDWCDVWQGRWGEKRVIRWHTNRPKQIAWAVRNYGDAVVAGDVSHSGDHLLTKHIVNARKQKLSVYDDKHRQMHTLCKDRPDSPRKIDAAMAAVISREARGDAIAAGAKKKKKGAVFL